jgi:hypothetical protein
MTRQWVRLIAAEITSMTKTHSRFSGDFLYDMVVEEFPTSVWPIFQVLACSTLCAVWNLPGFSSGILKSLGINLDPYVCVDLGISRQEPTGPQESFADPFLELGHGWKQILLPLGPGSIAQEVLPDVD